MQRRRNLAAGTWSGLRSDHPTFRSRGLPSPGVIGRTELLCHKRVRTCLASASQETAAIVVPVHSALHPTSCDQRFSRNQMDYEPNSTGRDSRNNRVTCPLFHNKWERSSEGDFHHCSFAIGPQGLWFSSSPSTHKHLIMRVPVARGCVEQEQVREAVMRGTGERVGPPSLPWIRARILRWSPGTTE
jgi:hypothetical protein